MSNCYYNCLNNLPLLLNAKTRSISAENPTGEKGQGAKAIPDANNPAFSLGKGWKVRPCIFLPKQSISSLADIESPGIIQHIWFTISDKAKFYRKCILRFFWDNEETPSVEVPLGDFFANGHSHQYPINSLPVVVNSKGGLNCYWPMPFKTRCRIIIENQSEEDIGLFYYQITYAIVDEIPEQIGYFHAQYRHSIFKPSWPEYIILDKVQNKGHYVGTFLAWSQFKPDWWGEGEIKFFIDDDKEYPTICGTGTEDYVGGAFGFTDGTYSTPFLGYPFFYKENLEHEISQPSHKCIAKHGLYRWHIMDPIRFEKNLKVTIQGLGYKPPAFFPLEDEISSVAYWYQTEPHTK